MESVAAFQRRVARAASRGRLVVNLESRAKALGVKVGGAMAAPAPAARKAAPAKADPNEPNFDGMTKDELYEYAQEWDLDGRSEMKKPELLAAVKKAWIEGD